MAFSFFGKKDKNPPQVSEPVATTPPNPPKIQTPPPPESLVIKPPKAAVSIPLVKPSPSSGLMPSSGVFSNAATTQPMSIPRTTGMLKPARPGEPPTSAPRSTRRLVLPGATTGTTAMKVAPPDPTGTVNLPIGMILRCLPPEVLTSDITNFETSGAAATEIVLPLNTILSQLPSGKVEMPFEDIVERFPAGFLQPAETIAPYLSTLISLPLMDVVMRIPPNLLTLRPDQKDVDSAVTSMADPFTEEGLREQHARRAQGQANIVDESQVAPAEEFVPQVTDTGALNRAVVPPSRSSAPPQTGVPTIPGSPVFRSDSPVRTSVMPNRFQTMPAPPPIQDNAASVRPLLAGSQSLSASQSIPAPRPPTFRPATPPVSTPETAMIKPPGPVVPPASGEKSLPTSLPFAPMPPSAPLPVVPQIPPVAASEVISASPEPSAPVESRPPDANADDLQRLAALAMEETGDEPAIPGESLPLESLPPEQIQPESSTPSQPPVPFVPLKAEPVVAATARLKLPEFPVKDLSQTVPVLPAKAETGRLPGRPELIRRSITDRVPSLPEPTPIVETTPPVPADPEPSSVSQPESPASADQSTGSVAINLNSCTAEDLLSISGLSKDLAQAIVAHRTKIGEFRKLEDLLDVPGMTGPVYSSLTGEAAPSGLHHSINDLLGFPHEQEVSLKDITDRISCWPDVTGCLLSQRNGLVLVGSVPAFLDKAAIVAFAPRIFDELNKSFSEITHKQTDELIIPTTGTSFHLLREKDLYLTILARVPQMPERHMKIARFVLSGLSVRKS